MLLRRAAIACGALALVAAIPAARAQEATPSQLAAARELVQVSGISTSIERILPALVDEIRRQAVSRPEMTKDLEEVFKGPATEIEQQRQQAYYIAARSYAKFLTEPEIKDTITFFKSPSGAKFIKLQPDVTDDLVNNVTAWTQLAAEYIQTRVRSEMLKRGHQMQ